METYGYVYKIVCKLNGKLYVGQTIRDIPSRWRGHKHQARRINITTNMPITYALAKYGIENFMISAICRANNQEELNHRERLCIKLFNSMNVGYNLKEGGLNSKHTTETKRKMSLASKGKHKSKIHKENIRKARLGTKQPDSVKFKCSNSQKGKKSSWFGRRHTQETKRAIGIAHKGKIITNQQKEKQRIIMTGRKASNETKSKMSIKRKGRKPNQKIVLCISNNQIYPSLLEASKQLNISVHSLGKHLKGKLKTAQGFLFKYN